MDRREENEMTKKLYSLLFLVMAVLLLSNCSPDTLSSAPTANLNATERVERGRYLVTAMGCNDCHTPLKMTDQGPVPDITSMLSGHPSSLKMPRPPQLKPGPWVAVSSGTNTAF